MVRFIAHVRLLHWRVCPAPISTSACLLSFFSGVDVPEAEEDCTTEATTATSFEPTTQSHISTVELDESAPEQQDVSPAEEEEEDTSPVEEPPQKEKEEEEGATASPEDVAPQPKEERDSEKGEEQPEGDSDSSSQSVDELLADWREDLEAFQQMEKDEL